MAESTFNLEYEGPALETGRMPVRDLAPALIALAELFSETSAILYPEREPVTLNIQAEPEKGSFIVHLLIETKKAWDELIDLFGTDAATALANLQNLVVGGEIGLFYLVKWLYARHVVSREPGPGHGEITLTMDDQSTLTVPRVVLDLYDNVQIRRKAREVVAPLAREGIEEMRFTETETEITITKNDLPAFDVPTTDEETLNDQFQEMILQITTLTFEGNRWKLSDGQRALPVIIDDDGWLRRVEEGEEVFRNGDMLRCRMRVVQKRVRGRLTAEYRVVEVIEHLPRQPQLKLGQDDG